MVWIACWLFTFTVCPLLWLFGTPNLTLKLLQCQFDPINHRYLANSPGWIERFREISTKWEEIVEWSFPLWIRLDVLGGSKSCTICPNEANPQWTNYNAIVKWAEHCFFAKQTQISIIELLLWLDWAGTGRTFLGQCLRGVHLISAWQWTPQHTQHTDAVCSTRMLLLISGWSPMSLWSDDLCKDLRLFSVCLSKRDNRFICRLHSEIDLHSNLD